MSKRIKSNRLEAIRTSRFKAIARNEDHFCPGVPCKRGHIGKWATFADGPSPRCYRCIGKEVKKRDPSVVLAAATAWRPVEAEWKKPDKCECCGRPEVYNRYSFHRDHDHGTGRFRGWLCSQCNTGIGMLGDNVLGVQRAAEYLQVDREQWW